MGPDEAVDTHRSLFKPAPVAMGVNVQTRMAAVILQSADQGGLTGSGLDDQPCLPFVLGRIALRKEDIPSLRALCSNGTPYPPSPYGLCLFKNPRMPVLQIVRSPVGV